MKHSTGSPGTPRLNTGAVLCATWFAAHLPREAKPRGEAEGTPRSCPHSCQSDDHVLASSCVSSLCSCNRDFSFHRAHEARVTWPLALSTCSSCPTCPLSPEVLPTSVPLHKLFSCLEFLLHAQLSAQVPLAQGHLPDYLTNDIPAILGPHSFMLFLPSLWKCRMLYPSLLSVSLSLGIIISCTGAGIASAPNSPGILIASHGACYVGIAPTCL